MLDPHAAAVTRAAREGPRVAGIDGQCESAHEADCCCRDSPRDFKEAEAATLFPRRPKGEHPRLGPAARMMCWTPTLARSCSDRIVAIPINLVARISRSFRCRCPTLTSR